MVDIADEWEAQGNLRPILSFAGTPALARQVEQGAPADIVISADHQWMNWLDTRGLIRPDTRTVVLGNALALVGSEPNGQNQTISRRLAELGDGRLAIADPESVPAGRYAKSALLRMGLWESVEDRVVPTDNVRNALALVETGEARLGIVYATDAQASDLVYNARQFDVRYAPEISYPGAVTTEARHADAKRFLDFLHSESAHMIFAEHGFSQVENAL